VYLPKYPPDLNPIEQVFAKFRILLRKAGARIYDVVADATAAIRARCPPDECAGYVTNSGHA
jgi:transposase